MKSFNAHTQAEQHQVATKKIHKLMKGLLLVFAVFMIWSIQVKADCPPGAYPYTTLMNIGGCEYKVTFCVICDPIIKVSIGSFFATTIPCNNGLTVNQVIQEIETQLFDINFLLPFITPCGFEIPPCPDKSRIVELTHWICWKGVGYDYDGQFTIKYEPCTFDYYCYEKVYWCYDPATGLINQIVLGYALVGDIACKLEEKEVKMPTEVGQESDCFIYHTPCNP